MKLFFTIAYLFIIGACAGWVLEVFYRRFFSAANPEHRWINPGFLTGPWVPLYGFGLTILYFFCRIDLSFLGPVWAQRLMLFALMGIAMTLIELIAGEIFILGMHVKLWDYSHLWGNYKGVICPLFSAIWTVLGIAFYYFVYPAADTAVQWLGGQVGLLFVLGLLYGVFAVDLCSSIKLGARIRKFAEENNLVVRYEAFKIEVRNLSKNNKFFRNLVGNVAETPLFEYLRAYREKYPSPLSRRYKEKKEKEAAALSGNATSDGGNTVSAPADGQLTDNAASGHGDGKPTDGRN